MKGVPRPGGLERACHQDHEGGEEEAGGGGEGEEEAGEQGTYISKYDDREC